MTEQEKFIELVINRPSYLCRLHGNRYGKQMDISEGVMGFTVKDLDALAERFIKMGWEVRRYQFESGGVNEALDVFKEVGKWIDKRGTIPDMPLKET